MSGDDPRLRDALPMRSPVRDLVRNLVPNPARKPARDPMTNSAVPYNHRSGSYVQQLWQQSWQKWQEECRRSGAGL